MEPGNARSVDAIESLSVLAIKKNPRNARVHDPKQIAKLASSIKRFGFVAPILIDDSNRLLCGHARVEAAALVGMTAVPAVRIQHLSQAEKRAFVIADNRLAELATWDHEILREELTGALTVPGRNILAGRNSLRTCKLIHRPHG